MAHAAGASAANYGGHDATSSGNRHVHHPRRTACDERSYDREAVDEEAQISSIPIVTRSVVQSSQAVRVKALFSNPGCVDQEHHRRLRIPGRGRCEGDDVLEIGPGKI